MLLQPEKGGGRKSLNDTHCWANSVKGQSAPYSSNMSTYSNTVDSNLDKYDSNLDKYRHGQQSSEVPFGGGLLIAYATFLGLFVAIQEVLNFAPDGKSQKSQFETHD
jgi:hypothetical protein